MVTRRGRLVLLLAVVLLAVGRILGIEELFGLAVAAAAAAGYGILKVSATRVRVSVTASIVPPVVFAGERASYELAIENTGSTPTPVGRLTLLPAGGGPGPLVEVPRLVPGERATVSMRVRTDRRGRHAVAGFDALLTDAVGIAERRLTGLGTARYSVRPLPEPLAATLPSGGGGTDLETTRSASDRLRSGASALRGYVAGDDLRRVHWPTTARIGDLMVREGGDRERDETSGVVIVLNPRVLGTLRRPAPTGLPGTPHPSPPHSQSGELHSQSGEPHSQPGEPHSQPGEPHSPPGEPHSRPGEPHSPPGELGSEYFEDAVRVAASLATAAERDGPFRLVVPGLADTGKSVGERHLDVVLDALTGVRPVWIGRNEPLATRVPSWADTDEVVLVVTVCEDRGELPMLLGTPPERIGQGATAVVVVCTGSTDVYFDQVSRRLLFVGVPSGQSLTALWSAGEKALAYS